METANDQCYGASFIQRAPNPSSTGSRSWHRQTRPGRRRGSPRPAAGSSGC
jgi:hypothetical protein